MEYDASRKYGSMTRSYERFEQLTVNAGNTISLHASRDAADDFFQHCYHLKDWLKKSSSIPPADIEKFISTSRPIALAADYSNSYKHGGLDKSPRSGMALGKTNVHTKLDITPQGFVATSRLVITIDGEPYDAFNLASDCVREWDSFLSSKGIKFK